MKNKLLIVTLLLISTSLLARQYPDSVRQQSKAEPNIAYGWNFEFGGGAGVGSYLYTQLFDHFTPEHTVNKIAYPTWHGGIGINYYFVPWMGIGTGAQFSAYTNRASIDKPWELQTTDEYGDNCMIISTGEGLVEHQNIYMLEVPLALKFRARPGVVGFTGTAGVKVGIPMMNNQKLSGGTMQNAVFYKTYDLTMSDIAGVIEDLDIAAVKKSLDQDRFKRFNYAAYVELGMLFRLHQRVELAVAAYANYYFTDILDHHSTTDLGFEDGRSAGKYPVAYTQAYYGVLQTNEVKELHPWSAGIKLGLQINANRTKAQREYDRGPRHKTYIPEQRTDTVVITQQEPEPINRDEAIERIRQLAADHNIDLCETFCPTPEAVEPEPVRTDSVAAVLDEELQRSIIYFFYDEAEPILEPTDILERIAAVLVRHPEQKIRINGHTCRIGTPEYNQKLALRRANAVADRLRALGVRNEQMIIRSLGEDVPYRYNKHPYAKDRRVEIVPISKDEAGQ